jgi:hypothetical protein
VARAGTERLIFKTVVLPGGADRIKVRG